MDVLPSQVIRMVQLGLDEVLEAEAIWYCASCQTCLSRCPRGVDLPRLMEALRQVVLRDEGDRLSPADIPDEILKEAPQLAVIGILRKLST
jgi:heterodisulfide reductase subunit C